MKKNFSKREALVFGWNTVKGNFGFFIGLLIISGLLYLIPYGIAEIVSLISKTIGAILSGFDLAITVVISLGIVKIGLKFCDNEKVKISDLFTQYPLFFKYLGGYVLYALIVFGGLILFIIPGIIWAIKYSHFDYFIVDKGLGPIKALKRSAINTKGVRFNLFIFHVLLLLINVIGAMALLVGLFVTIPLSIMAGSFVYRKLSTQTEEVMGAINN